MKNKFTKEQYLLLTECEFVMVDAMTDDCDELVITEDFEREVLQLAERLQTLLPDMTEIAIKQMEATEDEFLLISMGEVSKLAMIHFQVATKLQGTTTKAAIYPILYLAKKIK